MWDKSLSPRGKAFLFFIWYHHSLVFCRYWRWDSVTWSLLCWKIKRSIRSLYSTKTELVIQTDQIFLEVQIMPTIYFKLILIGLIYWMNLLWQHKIHFLAVLWIVNRECFLSRFLLWTRCFMQTVGNTGVSSLLHVLYLQILIITCISQSHSS